MHRGCLSDSKNSRIFCEKNSFMCVTCGEDGCNNHPLLTPSKLSCHKCNHSTECGYGQVDQQTIQECIGSVWVSICICFSFYYCVALTQIDEQNHFTSHSLDQLSPVIRDRVAKEKSKEVALLI